jgi:type II secretory pathway pseudopilin PulG
LLSDHAISMFGRTLTITSREELVAIVVIAVLATAWAVQLFRRKRTVVVQRSTVSDQMIYELSRIADALDRIANRPADEAIAAASRRLTEKPPANPLSIFGRERPQG